MKKSFIIFKRLLSAGMVFMLISGNCNVVSAEEAETSFIEETDGNGSSNDTVAESMETPIFPEESSYDTDNTADTNSTADTDGTADIEVVPDSGGTDSGWEQESSADLPSYDMEDSTEDSTEIAITEINSEDIVFEDDIIYINPCYADTMSADDLIEGPEEEPLDPTTAPTLLADIVKGDITYTDSAEELAADIRENLVARNTSFTVYYAYANSDYSDQMKTVFTLALNHTGIYYEGDYLRWTYGGYKGSISGLKSGGTYYLKYTYTVTYYTTSDQEAVFDAAVDNAFSENGIYGMETDFEKIKAIYQYICSHVTYDYTNLNDEDYKLKYTAYAALLNGTAVCQGYSNLFYYMSLKAGIDARFISGTGNGSAHGWNIVLLDGLYYNLDTTWDAKHGDDFAGYQYFLKSDADFTGHVRNADFTTDSFYAAYPMASESYLAQNLVSVYGHNLVLDGRIGVNFYLDVADAVKKTTGSYATLLNTISGASEDFYMDDMDEEDGHYCFTFPVTAKEMADPITLTFYDGTTGEVLCTDTYSAADYAEEQIEAGDSVSDLVAAMLDYGTCAQNYFGYQTDTPANAAISTEGTERTIPEVDAESLAGYARVKSGTLPEGIKSYGQSLVLNDGVSVKLYYQLDDGAEISDYTASLVSGDTSTPLEWQESGNTNCYYVRIDDISAADLDTMYQIDVTDGTSTGSISYGAMTYVYLVLSGADGYSYSDSLQTLCRSLYYYSQAAEQYFAE